MSQLQPTKVCVLDLPDGFILSALKLDKTIYPIPFYWIRQDVFPLAYVIDFPESLCHLLRYPPRKATPYFNFKR